jgi:hypothetical protein
MESREEQQEWGREWTERGWIGEDDSVFSWGVCYRVVHAVSNTSGAAYMSATPAYNATRPEAHNHTKADGLKMTNRAQGYNTPPCLNACLTPSRRLRKLAFDIRLLLPSRQWRRHRRPLNKWVMTDAPLRMLRVASTFAGSSLVAESRSTVDRSWETTSAVATNCLSNETWTTRWILASGGKSSRYATLPTFWSNL